MGAYIEVTKQLLELVEQKKSAREISRILNIDYSTVHRKLRKLNINLPNYHNELKFDNTVFDIIDTEEKAYWLGFIYADGYVAYGRNTFEITLKGSDINHLEKFNRFIKNQKPVKQRKQKCGGKIFDACRCYVVNKHFHDRLIELGCIPRKSLILKFPSIEIFKYEDLIYPFIRGYIDGDGSVGYTWNKKLRIQIIGTKEFLTGIKNYFPQFTLYKEKRKGSGINTYTLDCGYDKAFCVALKIYSNASVYLDRKYEKFCRVAQKYAISLSDKIGEGCDANTEVNTEITQGSVSPQSVGGE